MKNPIQSQDPEAWKALQSEIHRQQEGLEMIASENYASQAVMAAQGSELTNKYAEGYPGKRYYGGCEHVDVAERLAIERAGKLFGTEFVNVQPHSGAQANMAVYFSSLQIGDTILAMNLAHGGHLTHGMHLNFSGKWYKIIPYGVRKEDERLDMDEIARLAKEHKPKMIVAGASAYSRTIDFSAFASIASDNKALFMVDMAHPAGLIAAGLLENPVNYAHIVTSTTHKTLRGPRGGIILLGKDFENPWGLTTKKGELKMMSSLLDSAIFPGIQGGPLEHVIASKAVAFGEALEPGYKDYQILVQKNARVMAKAFIDKGYKVISGGTDNHSMLIDLRTKFPDLSGKKAENALVLADITINKNMVPFDSRSPFLTSGLRVGTPAITTRGMKEADMALIVDLIDEVLQNPEDESVISDVRGRVNQMMEGFPMFAW